ncbi:hypothetical protein OE88DRAFT_522281 [Heliocybe sulcata]|uniref:Ankyrin n=1 Tax=Heliocybe sulcata TaxID=5364 RepID=A0A5C3MUE5_9AGAM|nr:hypothetical protein OE88DRAFT_522281 [Heliocybe sulcata]
MPPDVMINIATLVPTRACALRLGEKGQTLLRAAAQQGEPSLALEMIRLGACIDYPDTELTTPLVLGLTHLVVLTAVAAECPAQLSRSEDYHRSKRRVIRIAWVCKLIIEQHADVNKTDGDYAPLDLACKVEHWNLITLLLEHGANPERRGPDGLQAVNRLTATGSKTRFLGLVRKNSNPVRPAKPCPCWSGKLLDECHALGPKPYPSVFLCRSVSGKLHGNCRLQRNVSFQEVWYKPKQALVTTQRSYGDPRELCPQMSQWDFSGSTSAFDIWRSYTVVLDLARHEVWLR